MDVQRYRFAALVEHLPSEPQIPPEPRDYYGIEVVRSGSSIGYRDIKAMYNIMRLILFFIGCSSAIKTS